MGILQKFDSTYEGLPAARFGDIEEYNTFRLLLIRAEYSFKTKIVPPKKNRKPREIIIMLVGNSPPEAANGP